MCLENDFKNNKIIKASIIQGHKLQLIVRLILSQTRRFML